MRTILYVIAVIMVIGWIFGFIVYAIGGLIHILLVIAVISILYNLFNNKTSSA